MGLDAGDLKFLLSGMKLGIKPGAVLTLGRQSVLTGLAPLHKLLRSHGLEATISSRSSLLFGDDIFKAIGFESCDSMDAVSYEDASIVHDLNDPVAESLHQRFDLVWDGGTLEHVFNFPVAISNALKMVKVGGHFVGVTPTNNQCGHGFYQFSPELFFRIFVAENGFELIRMYIAYKGRMYHVTDPAIVHGRVELLCKDGAMLYIHARKLREVPLFVTAPQQSDYVSLWDKATDVDVAQNRDGHLKKLLRNHLSESQVLAISRVLNVFRQKRNVYNWRKRARLSNRAFFTPVTQWDVPSPGLLKLATSK